MPLWQPLPCRLIKAMSENLKKIVFEALEELNGLTVEELKAKRYEKFRNYGEYTE